MNKEIAKKDAKKSRVKSPTGKDPKEAKESLSDAAEPAGTAAPAESGARKPGFRRPAPRRQESAEGQEYVEKVLAIKRVTKVTKGGKRLAFSALVVVGDGKGRVGFGLDKAGEVANAIKKSLLQAKKRMVTIPLKGKTIPHEIIGSHGAAQVLLKPASEGTGVIASGAVRAVCDGAGIRDILTKCHRSNNAINVVKATFDGLTRLKSVAPKETGTENANQ